MPWCLPPIGTNGQVHPRSQGLLLGQGSTACPLATLRWIHPFLTRILHVLGPVSTASHCLCILVFKDKHFVKIEFKYIYYFYFYYFFFCNMCLCLWFRFTSHAYQYASTPQATSAPLGCLHSYYPHPQCLACASAPFPHSLPCARPGRKLPLLTSGALFGFSYYETAPTEDHPAGSQCEWRAEPKISLLSFIS